MNFLADEGVDRQIVDRLRADGHEVCYAAESAPATPDDHLLQYANEHHAIVVTSGPTRISASLSIECGAFMQVSFCCAWRVSLLRQSATMFSQFFENVLLRFRMPSQ